MSVRGIKLLALVLCLTQYVACSRSPDVGATELAAYLFAWAGDQDEREGDSNFLAVIDVDPASATYRQIVATAPIGTVGGMPHHSEAEMPPDGHPLFANAFAAGRSWLFDLSNPLEPTAVGEVDSVPGYHMPHSFLRVADGTVLVTMQFGAHEAAGLPGGLARFAPDGRLLSISSSADPAFEGARIRTYALDASEVIDRVGDATRRPVRRTTPAEGWSMTCRYRSASSPPNPARKREVSWTVASGPRGLTPIR